ncbi:isochorismatase family protein, partial [bacterium]|nr:isochorismatase family protein [bacterium]
PQNTALVVVDPQERLMAVMDRRAETLTAIQKLAAAAAILELPRLLTLQYVKGLGPLAAELTETLAGVPTVEKLTFSSCGVDAFTRTLKDWRRPRVLLCGVEAHVCVQQTTIDLLDAGYAVYVAIDALCSRRDLDRDVAIARMRDCGAVITTVESAVFELLREAGTDTFKKVLPLFR